MSSNFRIALYRDKDILHLKLIGDFDAGSAFELLRTLTRDAPKTSRVFIHCSSLNEIYPFGVAVFHNNLDEIKEQSKKIVFIGENASQLAPDTMKQVI